MHESWREELHKYRPMLKFSFGVVPPFESIPVGGNQTMQTRKEDRGEHPGYPWKPSMRLNDTGIGCILAM